MALSGDWSQAFRNSLRLGSDRSGGKSGRGGCRGWMGGGRVTRSARTQRLKPRARDIA